MDMQSVLATLNDLPSTFKRNGPPYTQFVDSLASALALYTIGADATFSQATVFDNAVDGWLDIWGLLFGIPRDQNQANATFQLHIKSVMNAWVGTVPAVQAWMDLFAPGGNVVENQSGGYVLLFSGATPLTQIQSFLRLFNRIRPNGVPFQIEQSGLGLYLGTEEFLGDGRVVGNYLTALSSVVAALVPVSTANAVPLLADLLLSDPTINPNLAATLRAATTTTSTPTVIQVNNVINEVIIAPPLDPLDIHATGSTQGTAAILAIARNYVVSGIGGTVLPDITDIGGKEIPVYNRSGATIIVYPASGNAIEGNAINVGVPLANYGVARFSVDQANVIRMA